MSSPLKIGVIGTGREALECMRVIQADANSMMLVGFFATEDSDLRTVMHEFGLMPFHHPESLIESSDAVILACAPDRVYELARLALRSLKHVFVIGPPTLQAEHARECLKIIREARIVGHVWNPLVHTEEWQYILQRKAAPAFMQLQLSLESTDSRAQRDGLSWINDIQLMLQLSEANARRVSANGVWRMKKLDVCNTRIELDNGCVADLTLQLDSDSPVHMLSLHTADAQFDIDFIQHVVVERSLDRQEMKWMRREHQFEKVNNLTLALDAWRRDMDNNHHSGVSWHSAARSLELSIQIMDKLNSHVLLQDPDVFMEP